MWPAQGRSSKWTYRDAVRRPRTRDAPKSHTPVHRIRLQWTGAPELAAASKALWHLGNNAAAAPAGYVRVARSLTQVVVRGGGHILPYDQPERSLDMITRFVTGKPFAAAA